MGLPDEYVRKITLPRPVTNADFLFEFPDIIQVNATEYMLQKEYSVLFLYGINAYNITVKPGFIYDGFSVPLLFHSLQSPFTGKGTPAALLHDLDFMTHFTGNLRTSNWMFLTCLEAADVGWWKRNILYSGVQAGGWWKYPKDPKTIIANHKFLNIQQME